MTLIATANAADSDFTNLLATALANLLVTLIAAGVTALLRRKGGEK